MGQQLKRPHQYQWDALTEESPAAEPELEAGADDAPRGRGPRYQEEEEKEEENEKKKEDLEEEEVLPFLGRSQTRRRQRLRKVQNCTG